MKKIIILSLAISGILLWWCFGKKTTVNTEEYKDSSQTLSTQTSDEARAIVEHFIWQMKECKVSDSIKQDFLSGEIYYKILQKNAKSPDLDQECINNWWTGFVYTIKDVIYNQNDSNLATAELEVNRWWKNYNMPLNLKKVDNKWYIIDQDSKYWRQTTNFKEWENNTWNIVLEK